ncbi:MAG: trigger factor [Bacilli bacterium]|nr:trigger factor [Bacilli bacterium]
MENKNIKEMTIKIEGEKWLKALDKSFQKANAKAKIDGFRPGKAPKEIFIKKYGKEALYEEAINMVVEEAYDKAIEDNQGLEIVARPLVDIKDVNDDFAEFTFTFTLKPEVKLGKYKNLKVTKEETTVTSEEIAAELDNMLKRYAEQVSKDGKVELKDTAIIDFEGFKDGVPFDGGKAENYSLEIGSNTFIPGFEEQIIGLEKGEEKDLKIVFPEDYHSEDLKGKEVVFKVKVNEIKTTTIPELNKEFFEDLGMEGIDSKEALEKQIEENIKAKKESDSQNKYIEDLLKEAIKNMEVDVPDTMIDEETDRMIGNYEQHLKMQGLGLDKFYEFTNSTEADLRAKMKEEALHRVKERLLLESIIKEEKIEVNEEEVNARAEELASKYHVTKEELIKEFGGIEMVKYDLQIRKALDIVKGDE